MPAYCRKVSEKKKTQRGRIGKMRPLLFSRPYLQGYYLCLSIEPLQQEPS